MSDISDEQLEELKFCFDLFDKTGKERVPNEKIIDLLRSMGLNPLTVDVKKLLKDSDLKSNEIDFPTFVSIFEQFSKRPCIANYGDMMECFKTFDRESCGMISEAQLRQICLNLGDKMSEQEVDAMVTPHANADGLVPYDAMCKAVMAG